MSRRLVPSLLLLALLVPAAPALADRIDLGRVGSSGDRLSYARGDGGRICLRLTEPDAGRFVRGCARPSERFVRTILVARPCAFGTRLLGLVPGTTRKLNLSVGDETFRIRTRALRGSDRDRGRAFAIRRDLSGRVGTLTAYDAAGAVLDQRAFDYERRVCPAPAD